LFVTRKRTPSDWRKNRGHPSQYEKDEGIKKATPEGKKEANHISMENRKNHSPPRLKWGRDGKRVVSKKKKTEGGKTPQI